MTSRLHSVWFLLSCWLLANPNGMVATPYYGLTYLQQTSASDALGEVTNTAYDQIFLNQPILSYNNSYSVTSPTGISTAANTITSSVRSGNVALGQYSFASAPPGAGHTYAGSDLYFFDTLHINGPSNAIGLFQVNLTLDGSVTTTHAGFNGLNDGTWDLLGDLYLVENGTIIPGSQYTGIVDTIVGYGNPAPQTNSIDLAFSGGSTVTLGLLLQSRAEISDVFGTVPTLTAIVDQANTGFMTISPLDPGFSFTSASGLTYANAPVIPTPEPSAFILCAFGLCGIALCKMRWMFGRSGTAGVRS